ncbi:MULTISPECIES: hypothetical protein [unclassified Providencia]|uniref:hypothetical protein n=1 Tax=unclassified Providencia TaxID=2633465 RepID=UPI00234A4AB7|nr:MULTISPECIES: hypothetical protein [unclassified Providencia]
MELLYAHYLCCQYITENTVGVLLRSASKRIQVIVSTQSLLLLNEFELGDMIVVPREQGALTFKCPDADKFFTWLDGYSVVGLWEKSIIDGKQSWQ